MSSSTKATLQNSNPPPQRARHRRPLRLWFVVAVCVVQAVLITLAVALIFSDVREAAARVPGKPTPALAMVGGAIVTAYLAAALGLFLRQAWARPMTLTLVVLTMLATLGVALTSEEPRTISERWTDLAAVSPMLTLQAVTFAVLVLTPRHRLYAQSP